MSCEDCEDCVFVRAQAYPSLGENDCKVFLSAWVVVTLNFKVSPDRTCGTFGKSEHHAAGCGALYSVSLLWLGLFLFLFFFLLANISKVVIPSKCLSNPFVSYFGKLLLSSVI